MFFDIDIVIVISESELMGVEAGIGIGTGSNSSWVLYKYFPHTCSEPRSTWDLALYGNGNAADVAGIGTTKVLPSTATYHALWVVKLGITLGLTTHLYNKKMTSNVVWLQHKKISNFSWDRGHLAAAFLLVPKFHLVLKKFANKYSQIGD